MKFTAKNQIRIDVIARFIDGMIKREHAQEALELSERQFRRLIKKFREKGLPAVIHGNIGRAPINKTKIEIVDQIKKLATEDYKGFNMTHFREKLTENSHLKIVPSYGVIRRIFTEEKIYKPQKKRKGRPHKSRNRYEKEGLMVQMDGSPHVWFGHQMTCLISAIDDATGKILGMKFSKTETTFASMDVLEDVINTHGCFHILYTDSAGIFSNNKSKKRDGFTNVTRAMKQLDIVSICSQTAEARGRVERLHRTLQDRLISEMRIRNISTIEEANKYLPEFLVYFNLKFAVEPLNPVPAYRVVPENIIVNDLMYKRTTRTINRGSTFGIDNDRFVVENKTGYTLFRREIEIKEFRDGSKKYFIGNEEVQVEKLTRVRKARNISLAA